MHSPAWLFDRALRKSISTSLARVDIGKRRHAGEFLSLNGEVDDGAGLDQD
jgi:hypothetical protein